MRDLTVDEVLTIHRDLMVEEHGDTRVISEASLLQLVFHANLIPGVLQRASFVFYSLCAFPPFREGNERVARVMIERILGGECRQITGSTENLAALARGILEYTVEPEEIERWLENNTGCSRG